jgi:hypothetical protein
VKELEDEGDVNYIAPILEFDIQKDQYSRKMSSFMQDLLGNEHPFHKNMMQHNRQGPIL